MSRKMWGKEDACVGQSRTPRGTFRYVSKNNVSELTAFFLTPSLDKYS